MLLELNFNHLNDLFYIGMSEEVVSKDVNLN